MPEYKNRLAGEKSPYLQQHASNPVDWYPWGEDAFAKAEAEDRPIFLSIGYSTCHWCHVMEEESFEDRETAAFLNNHFVSIKVDREERPDIDKIYMDVVVATTGSGGWPLSVFLTPEGKPIYGGTYFPKESRWGMPGFLDVAASIIEAWTHQREKIIHSAEGIVGNVINRAVKPGMGEITTALAQKAYRTLRASYDPSHGGFSRAPKFPSPHNLRFLLNFHCQQPESGALDMALHTLLCMCRGGVFDQVGGGIHRYSVDPRWRVPHFEKMLYDQAGLVSALTEAWLITKNPELENAVRMTLEYVRCRLLSDEGVFYTAEDADSFTAGEIRERKEGAYYLWRQEELEAVLTPDEFACVQAAYGIKKKGNIDEDPHGEFKGMNILHSEQPAGNPLLEIAKSKLLAARNGRERPRLDDKTLVSWNGMMISAYAQAAAAFGDRSYATIAKQASAFILENLMNAGCELKHRYIRGEASVDGMLEDYAFMSAALIDLYQTDYDCRCLVQAKALADRMIALFLDTEDGGFYTTAKPAVSFARRQKASEDNATPSAASVAADTLFRLARILREPKYEAIAVRQIESISLQINSYPAAYVSTVTTLGFKFGSSLEFVLAEGERPEAAQSADRLIKSRHFPNSVIVKRPYNPDNSSIEFRLMPWLKDIRCAGHDVVLFICENGRCRLPAEGEKAVIKALQDL